MKRIRNLIQPLFFTLTLICFSLSPAVKANFADELQAEAAEKMAGKLPLTKDAWETVQSFFDIHHTNITGKIAGLQKEYAGLAEDAESSRAALTSQFEEFTGQLGALQSVFLKTVRGLSGVQEEDVVKWHLTGSTTVGHGLRLKKGAAEAKAADYDAQVATVATRIAGLTQEIVTAEAEIEALKATHAQAVETQEEVDATALETLTSDRATALEAATAAVKTELATLKDAYAAEAARDEQALKALTFPKAIATQEE